MKPFRPMLGCAANLKTLTGSYFGSFKLDGVRALVVEGVVLSRNFKPIPNLHVQQLFGHSRYNGLDGELIVGNPASPTVYRDTVSGVMTQEGEPDVTLQVFDDYTETGGFERRLHTVIRRLKRAPAILQLVEHRVLVDLEAIMAMEAEALSLGYEGLMLRHPAAPYKYGRSTPREGGMLKVKQFKDGEAYIIGAEELLHNANTAVRNQLGQLERSSHKANKIGLGTLGALQVVDRKTGVSFDIGTGFTAAERAELWAKYEIDLQNGEGWATANPYKHWQKHSGALLGKLVKYKYFPTGSKDKPRFPVFLGFRDPIDL